MEYADPEMIGFNFGPNPSFSVKITIFLQKITKKRGRRKEEKLIFTSKKLQRHICQIWFNPRRFRI